MGLIQLEDMEFFAYHGHYHEEQITGNKFIVNLTIDTGLEKAAKSDNLEDALNYQEAYNIVKQVMMKKSRLLENLASRILDALYERFGIINSATVKISKVNPPMGGQIRCVSVTLSR
ncbi:MAG: dihydroneopterin aldolase [Bacteroidales bacterium]|nr:dihydroneopterin aldolase [Bacteroidales bacterium]